MFKMTQGSHTDAQKYYIVVFSFFFKNTFVDFKGNPKKTVGEIELKKTALNIKLQERWMGLGPLWPLSPCSARAA